MICKIRMYSRGSNVAIYRGQTEKGDTELQTPLLIIRSPLLPPKINCIYHYFSIFTWLGLLLRYSSLIPYLFIIFFSKKT